MIYFWYNFRTNSYDLKETIALDTDEEACKYIPNTDFSLSIYDKYRKTRTVREAVIEVLKIYYGSNKKN